MEKYMTLAERDEILKKVLEFSKKNSIEGYHYSYAFGYVSVILTDEQLKNLEKGLN